MKGTTKKNFGKSGRSGAVLTLAGLFIMAMALAFTACVVEVLSNTNTIYSVEVSGTAQVGGTLSAVAKDLWGDEVTDAEFQWLRSDSYSSSSGFSAIPGATGDSYTLTASDSGKYVRVGTTNASSQADWGSTTGWEYSDPVMVRPPDAEITEITAGAWANGSISERSGQQWFQFTATAATQYIHVERIGLTDLWVNLFTSGGETVGSEYNYYSSSRSTNSWTVTSGETYFVRVRPDSSWGTGSGTYQIAFSASSTAPAANLAE